MTEYETRTSVNPVTGIKQTMTVPVLEKRSVLTPMYGKGKELCDLLRAELGIPERTTKFTVTFDVDDVVRVSCDYIPHDATQQQK